jgi:hypothetical protein
MCRMYSVSSLFSRPEPSHWVWIIIFITGFQPVFSLPVLPGDPAIEPVQNPGSPVKGLIDMADTGSTSLKISVAGSGFSNYTFGLFKISDMTAGVNDPDFQLQALQADSAMILHQAGKQVDNLDYSVEVAGDEELGIFILRDSSLADFSRGQNIYRPIFSLLGAPGNHLFLQDDESIPGSSIFSIASLESGQVMGTGAGSLLDMLRITISGHLAPTSNPIIPEPGTASTTLIGILLLHSKYSRRRRG